MATLEDRIRKINSLLAKAANNAATPQEAIRYAAHAAKLIAKHNIKQAMLDAARGEQPGIAERLVPIAAPFAREKTVLVAHIAAALHCRTVYLRNRARRTIDGVLLMGAPDDVARVLVLQPLLWDQAWQGVLSDVDSPDPGWLPGLLHFRRNWLRSFAAAVGARLKLIEDRAIAEDTAERAAARETGGPSTALVIRGRDVAVNKYYDDTYGAAESDNYQPPKAADQGALNGLFAGRRADIGLTKMEG